jgi:hypothetical protein
VVIPPVGRTAAGYRRYDLRAVAADAGVARYWQLICVINGWPVRPSMRAVGDWLMTALRSSPEPGRRAAAVAAVLDDDQAWAAPAEMVRACAEVLGEVTSFGGGGAAGAVRRPDPLCRLGCANPGPRRRHRPASGRAGHLRRPSAYSGGSFDPAQPVPDDATDADRVAAYLGRALT